MRIILSAMLFCTLAAPAYALPAAPAALAFQKSSPVVLAGKKSKTPAKRQSSSGGDGGIHPLVGSGGY